MNKTNGRTRADVIISRFRPERSLLGVEVGVFDGRTSKRLLEELPNLILFLVDSWSEYPKIVQAETLDAKLPFLSKEEFEAAYVKTLKAIEPYSSRAVVRRIHSSTEAKLHKKGTFDFVFIDADHTYDGCYFDLQSWAPKVAKGGYVFVHDYGCKTFPGVKRAVDKFFRGKQITVDDDRMAVIKL